MDAAVLGVLLVLSMNSLAIRFDFSSGTKPDTLLYECGDKHGLWTLEDAISYPGGPISGSVLTSSLEPCCLKLRNVTRLDESSRFRIKFRASFSLNPQDVMLVKLQGIESSDQITWLTLKTVSNYDWIDIDETFPGDITPGQYQIEIWKTSSRETISIRYFEIIESEKDVALLKTPHRRLPRFATDDVTTTPNDQAVSTSWLTNSIMTLAPDGIDYIFEICSCSSNSSVTSEYLNISTDPTTETTLLAITSPITTTETDITFETKLTTITLLENISTTTEMLIIQNNTSSETNSISEITTVIKLSSQIPIINITEESIIVSSQHSTVLDQISSSIKSLSTIERETIFTETVSSEATSSNQFSTLFSTTEPVTISIEGLSSIEVPSESSSSNQFSTLFSTSEAVTISNLVLSSTAVPSESSSSNQFSTLLPTSEPVTIFTTNVAFTSVSSETTNSNPLSTLLSTIEAATIFTEAVPSTTVLSSNSNEHSTSMRTNKPVTNITETTSSKIASSELISPNTVSLETISLQTSNSNEYFTNEPETTETVSSKTETPVTTNSNELSTFISTMTQTTDQSNTSTELLSPQSNKDSRVKEVGIIVGMVVLGLSCLLGLIFYFLVRKFSISAALKMINIRHLGTNKIKYKQTITI